MDNIQTLPNYLLPIKNWVLPKIIGSGRVGYPLPNGYGHPYPPSPLQKILSHLKSTTMNTLQTSKFQALMLELLFSVVKCEFPFSLSMVMLWITMGYLSKKSFKRPANDKNI